MTALVPHRGLADSLAELFDTIDAEPIAALLTEYRDRGTKLLAAECDPKETR